ncbi:unnamed protein product [Sphagnum compactum]
MPLLYPSIIFQERVLGFVMGSAVGVGAMLYDQRMIWRSTAQLFDKLAADRVGPSPPVQVPPPLLGKEVRDQLAHAWNSTVDNTLGALVVALSSRGW